jgi:predicted RNA-binding Zn-ribbon protein involved in translation (DUF1610 family)
LNQPPEHPDVHVASLLRRADARQLSCPYCPDTLQAAVIDARRVQLRCPSCGFTETPDRIDAESGR